MLFTVSADTDIGICKNENQDSVLVKHARCELGEVLMAIICDGMGGLSKGELASATVIRRFSTWFDSELPVELDHLDMEIIGASWSMMLKELNIKIMNYSQSVGQKGMGTTFTGILFVQNRYVIVHVGDSRVYEITDAIKQLTTDHTFVAREIKNGRMTPEEARTDKRRNLLLQCVGASKIMKPQILHGTAREGTYMLCSDGFRHEISQREMYIHLNQSCQGSQAEMHSNIRCLIEQVKKRGEKDNISAVLIKVEKEN